MSYAEVLEKHGLMGDEEFRYRMLSRLQADCDYYLGYGCRFAGKLWANNEEEHAVCMEALWESFPDDKKPEWLTKGQLESYISHLDGLNARIYQAFDSQWNVSDELKNHANEYRRTHPGLNLESTGLEGCAFHYKTFDGARHEAVVLKILPEYFVGNKDITALTRGERDEAYRALIPQVPMNTAREYLLEKVEMIGFVIGIDQMQKEKTLADGLVDERSLDDLFEDAYRRQIIFGEKQVRENDSMLEI